MIEGEGCERQYEIRHPVHNKTKLMLLAEGHLPDCVANIGSELCKVWYFTMIQSNCNVRTDRERVQKGWQLDFAVFL